MKRDFAECDGVGELEKIRGAGVVFCINFAAAGGPSLAADGPDQQIPDRLIG